MSKSETRSGNHKTPQRYIGLMSGTSIDGVDVALVEFETNNCKLIESYLHPVDEDTKGRLESLCSLSSRENQLQDFQNRVELLGELDSRMGSIFADAVNCFLDQENIAKESVRAIGSHGQTIRHQPSLCSPFTLQIGDPNLIAHHTGITTVSDFRRMDIAAGGQGAPLAPAFHNAIARSKEENRIILNLGGIANITLLPKAPEDPVCGFDTGPANTLLDAHFRKNYADAKINYDVDSEFARTGKCELRLLNRLLADPYFKLPPPKSTGREYFSINWLQNHLDGMGFPIKPDSIQATLVELTTQSIADPISRLGLDDYQVYACGGGMHNNHLLEQLGCKLGKPVHQITTLGLDGDYLEAMTFAWLAHQRLEQLPGNIPSVTGASDFKVLGAIYHP